MKTHRLNLVATSIILMAVLLFGFIPALSAHATASAWAITGSMAAARANHTATLLNNGKVLVTGGNSSDKSVELFDPDTGKWTPTGSLNFARSFHSATLLSNGKILVAGGTNDISAELYDPDTGTWTLTGGMHSRRDFDTTTLLSNGLVLVVGGKDSSSYLATAELYNPTTGLWTATGSMTNKRAYHTATLLPSGQVLVAGGKNTSGYLVSAELYDPTTGTWSATGPLTTKRAYHTATLLSNGKVLVVGGGGSGGYLASAELYDPPPGTGTWSGTSSLTNPRYYHTATLLSNGKVLVAGGSNAIGILNSAELYDPTTGTWPVDAAGPLITGRYEHTATQLFTGQVLATGGVGNSGNMSSAELYDPEPAISAPDVPVLISPNGITNIQPSYKWNYSSGATAYHLTVYSIDTSSPVINNYLVNPFFCSGGVCTYHPLGMLPVGNYEFKVNASNKIGTSADSAWMTFIANSDLSISGNVGASASGVNLTYFDVWLKTATSDSNGDYSFGISANWSGTVTPSLPGYYTFTPASRSYTNVLDNLIHEDYSATPIYHTISGNAGVGGATISFTNGLPITAESDGSYTIIVPHDWSGTVTPSKPGYTFTPASITVTTPVTSNLTGQDFTATLTTRTITGNAGVGGATLSYTDGSPVTAGLDGSYTITVPYGWSGTVTPSIVGYVFTPPNKSYTYVIVNQTNQNYTATAGYTISGNAGVGSATLTYTGGSTTANGSGDYWFTVLSGWTGTITPSYTGYTFTPTSITVTTPVTSNLTGQDFTATLNPYTVSGSLGANGAGASVTYTGGSTTANGSGDYSFTVPSDWTGTITPSKPGYTFTPTSITVTTPVISNLTGQDFTATLSSYSIYLPLVIR